LGPILAQKDRRRRMARLKSPQLHKSRGGSMTKRIVGHRLDDQYGRNRNTKNRDISDKTPMETERIRS